MENLDFIYSMFNQYLFQDAKNNIEQIDYYVRTNQATAGNKLASELIGLIKDFSFESIDYPMFQSIMMKTGKSPAESQMIIGEIIKWKNYSKDQMSQSKEMLKDVIASTIINRAKNKMSDRPYDFIKTIKEAEINIESISDSETINFADIDMNSIIADMNQNVYPSYHDWINKSFQPANGYEGSQLVMVAMPPGTGKSLFIMGEAISILTRVPDSNVYILCMGDMGKKDYIIRMGAILTGNSFYYAATHMMEMKAALDKAFGRRLTIEIADAGVIKIDEFVEKMERIRPKVFMVDYDANFDVNLGSDSSGMYTEFGNIYNKLIKVTRSTGALGFVAAQPMKASWCLEVINKDQVGESAKKIHSVDMCITAGVNQLSQNHIGIFKIAKSRRGEEGTQKPYIRLNNGRFKFISREVYSYLSSIQDQRDFTEIEIDTLIKQYANTKNNVVTGFGTTPQPRQAIQNPFSK